MATKTLKLGLVKPARAEFSGSWDIPMNANADVIDSAVGDLQTEVDAARGSQATLNARLNVAMDATGNIVPSAEIVAARISTVYGAQASIDARVELADTEILTARQNLSSLRDILANNLSGYKDNCVISAPNGFLSFTGANVYVNGSVTPVIADINGYRQVVSTQISTTISGVSGTYYVYLQRNSAGQIVLDRTGAGLNTGAITTDTLGALTVLNDATQNFVTQNIKAGSLVQITSAGSVNLGTYVISAVNYNGNPNSLQIIGTFVSAQSNLNYKIIDPIAPTVGFSATAPASRFTPVSDKVYIGQAVFDGTNVTSVVSYALKGHYEGFTSVTLTGGLYSITVPHNLGYVPSNVQVFGTQASDFSVALERLSDGNMTSSSLNRNVITSVDKLNVHIKNPTNGVFYQDFSGATQTAGFVFVIVDR